MKYVLTDNRGRRIGHPMSDRKAIRQVARSWVRNGHAVMIYLAHDDGTISRYSSEDTAAVHKTRKAVSP